MQDEPLRRYALALALIPDADAAGDLFMDARTEQELRRRAAAWRRAHRLPAPADDPPLPSLSDEQRRHALHLLRRARGRRVLRRLLALGLAVALLAGGALALRASRDPVFAGLPARQTSANRFAVYRVEATPGQVTIWWSAAGQVGDLVPELELRALEEHLWVRPTATERRQERGRVLGRSTFKRLAGFVGEEHIRLGGDGAEVLAVPPVWRTEEPDARVIPVRWQGAGMIITAVTVHPEYTLVGVVPPRTVGLGGGLPSLTAERPDGPLAWRGSIPAQAPGQPVTYVFDPVPAGTRQLLLRPDSPSTSESVTFDLSGGSERLSIVRNDTNAEIVIPTGDSHLGMTSADLVDAEGHRYPASVYVRDAVTPTGIRHEFRVRAENVPPDAQLTEVTGVLLHQNPITIPVDLP